jgi:hypothetical protein
MNNAANPHEYRQFSRTRASFPEKSSIFHRKNNGPALQKTALVKL